MWDYYQELRIGSWDSQGLCALSFLEIEAWGRFKGVELCPWQVDVLRKLDVLFLKVRSDK